MLHEGLTIFDLAYVLLIAIYILVGWLSWREGYLEGHEDGRRRRSPKVEGGSFKQWLRRFRNRRRR